MSFKLFFAFIFSTTFFATDAFAQRGPRRDYPRDSDRSCSARDVGWEEHGSHPNCGTCLQRHEQCVETCAQTSIVCEARGRNGRGRTVIFRGQGRTRWEAESEARRSCEWNRNMRSCMVTGCYTSSSRGTTRACR